MADFVIDNSVVMAWCFMDEESSYADVVLTSLESAEAVVPAFWPLKSVMYWWWPSGEAVSAKRTACVFLP
ncbi:hypothetical protein GF1_21120 [Desulfolithobacter dissulfuricans]|uniref:Uncharacterized protein n=1 Tax=Desulfolithobacter dissulfuricans TaxID=2795293 RepID=A0A915U1L0_9BACT|nr:hypothetical protein [Desulfolithobacter dissulfuricans]BCO09736.1 hypothetical protein GF1_21120 [Desulfolithobacter dissulfuricans]